MYLEAISLMLDLEFLCYPAIYFDSRTMLQFFTTILAL